jgi:hypothetical protein
MRNLTAAELFTSSWRVDPITARGAAKALVMSDELIICSGTSRVRSDRLSLV